MKIAHFALATTLVFALAAPAVAQSRVRRHDGLSPPPSYAGRSTGRDGRSCQQVSVADTSPCDPTQFKQADGRLNEFLLW